jgi:hypothetical protein
MFKCQELETHVHENWNQSELMIDGNNWQEVYVEQLFAVLYMQA